MRYFIISVFLAASSAAFGQVPDDDANARYQQARDNLAAKQMVKSYTDAIQRLQGENKQLQQQVAALQSKVAELERQLEPFRAKMDVTAWHQLSDEACSVLLQCSLQFGHLEANSNTFDGLKTTIDTLNRALVEIAPPKTPEGEQVARDLKNAINEALALQSIYDLKDYIQHVNAVNAANPNRLLTDRELQETKVTADRMVRARAEFNRSIPAMKIVLDRICQHNNETSEEAIAHWKKTLNEHTTATSP